MCSKHFLTSKVDRSVGGLVVRGQAIGPFNLPLSNYSIVATSYFSNVGTVSSIGEQPLKGFHNPRSMVNMSIGEMLTNMIGAFIVILTKYVVVVIGCGRMMIIVIV